MIAHVGSLAGDPVAATHGSRRKRALVSARTCDHLRRMSGRSWHVPQVSRKKLARALHVHDSNISRRRGGESPKSHLSETAIEALELNIAGISAAFMQSRLRIVAEYPALLPLSVPELQERLRTAVLAELSVDAYADLAQATLLAGDTGDVMPLRDACDSHASALLSICAIAEVLHGKREGAL